MLPRKTNPASRLFGCGVGRGLLRKDRASSRPTCDQIILLPRPIMKTVSDDNRERGARQHGRGASMSSALTEKLSELPEQMVLKLRALADRTRLRVLCLLHGRELCVGSIVAILRVAQPRVSWHLAYLRKADMVVVRKSGLKSYYSLAEVQTVFHQKLLEFVVECFQETRDIDRNVARTVGAGRLQKCDSSV